MYRYPRSSMSLELHIRAFFFFFKKKTKQYHNNYNTQRSQQFSLPINCAFTSWQILHLTLLDAIQKKFQRCHFLSSPDYKVAR